MKRYKLGEICEIVSGSTPQTSIDEYWDGDLKWITPAELNDETFVINDSVRKITALGAKKTGLSPFPEGTVILSSRAPIGKVAIAGCEMYCNQGFKNLICSEKINNRYLYWFLKCKTEFLNSLGRGATFKEISKKIVADIEINVPDLEQQLSVVKDIEKVSEVIQFRKRELQKLDDLVKARFVEMFDASSADKCTKRIKEYAEVLGGYAFKSDLFCTDAVPVIRISNINNGRVELDDSICFDKMFWEQNKRFRAEQNDILMAMSGATTGKAGLYKENAPALINQRVACIRAKDGIACPTFLFTATQLEWMYDLIQETSAGCAQPNISGKQIENMPVPNATYKQQQQFATFVEQTDKSKAAVQKSLDKLQILFDKLMQEYFG